jgi:hypothetical protein
VFAETSAAGSACLAAGEVSERHLDVDHLPHRPRSTTPKRTEGVNSKRVEERLIKTDPYSDPNPDCPQRDGYLAFLRAINTRAAGADWPTVKARLGRGERQLAVLREVRP